MLGEYYHSQVMRWEICLVLLRFCSSCRGCHDELLAKYAAAHTSSISAVSSSMVYQIKWGV